MTKPLIIIPARMASTRLPGKPLSDIAGKPMIIHVLERCLEVKDVPVVVASGDDVILEVVKSYGGVGIKTHFDHQSGSDRIFEALKSYDPEGTFDTIINVQGDLPLLEPYLIENLLYVLEKSPCDIATLATLIEDKEEIYNPNVVKIAMTPLSNVGEDDIAKALYFSRAAIPHGEGDYYHHIGLYGYHRNALERFVSLGVGALERVEKLEQLRALENGMSIYVGTVHAAPLGVDTKEDLEYVRSVLASKET